MCVCVCQLFEFQLMERLRASVIKTGHVQGQRLFYCMFCRTAPRGPDTARGHTRCVRAFGKRGSLGQGSDGLVLGPRLPLPRCVSLSNASRSQLENEKTGPEQWRGVQLETPVLLMQEGGARCVPWTFTCPSTATFHLATLGSGSLGWPVIILGSCFWPWGWYNNKNYY